MKYFILLFTLVFFVFTSFISSQSPGDLDTTFGIGGIVKTDIVGYIDAAYDVAIQSDGKIILAGYSIVSSATPREITLVRYMSDGSLDNTFGTNGIVISDITSSDGEAYSIAIQSDDKIIAAGYSEVSGINIERITVLRYNSDGTLDNTFGTNGFTVTDIDNSGCYSVVIQTDGKIIVAGRETSGDMVLVRFNTDGSLDNSFGSGGVVITDISSADEGRAIALQPDGKIVVTGQSFNQSLGQGSIFVARYDSTGTLDGTFGTSGIVLTTIGSVDDDAVGKAITIQQDGKILVAGNSNSTGSFHFTTIRYNSDGSLDNSFGINGIRITTIGSDSDGNSIAIDQYGNIIVGGKSNGNFALARYNTIGNLDIDFGTGGIVTTNLGNNDKGYSLVIQSDDKIVLAGESQSGFSDFAVARYIGVVPEITITSPNGGENWQVRTNHFITWNNSNVEFIDIELTTNNGTNWSSIVDNYLAATGYYLWTIPNTPSTQCRVRISNTANFNITDLSDELFNITENIIISLLVPNGGEIWIQGSTENISWTSENVISVKIELSINNGASWSTITDSTASTGIYSWLVNASQTSNQALIRISDLTNGNILDQSDDVFTIDIAPAVDEEFSGIPDSYKLLQNYPNPFNPSTTIYYGLPVEASVKITIYDVLGNEVMVYSEKKQEAGYHRVEFDATVLPSGIYFYRLQAGNFAETKKMVLMK